MPKVISLVHQKGGVGKSTLAFNLACCFAHDFKVAIIDIDPQGSIASMGDKLGEIEFINCSLSQISELEHDIVFVDTPPYLTNQLTEVFNQSNLVLIPTKAGVFDIMAIRTTISLLKKSQQENESLQGAVILNMVKPRTSLTLEAREIISSMGVDVLETEIPDKVSITRSVITNGIKDDEKASEIFNSLAFDVIDILKRSVALY